jgi:hypothetical protein
MQLPFLNTTSSTNAMSLTVQSLLGLVAFELLLERSINCLWIKKLLLFVLRRKLVLAVLFSNLHLHHLHLHLLLLLKLLKVFQGHFINIFKLKKRRYNFDFEDFRSFLDECELFGEEDVFETFKIEIGIGKGFDLVQNLIIKGIYSNFTFLLLVEGEWNIGLLVLGIANDTGLHFNKTGEIKLGMQSDKIVF